MDAATVTAAAIAAADAAATAATTSAVAAGTVIPTVVAGATTGTVPDLTIRAGLAARLARLDVSGLNDNDLKKLCDEKEFHPGVHGVTIVRRCVGLGRAFDLNDALDLARVLPIDALRAILDEMKFAIPDGTAIAFCPKDPEVLRWLRSFCVVKKLIPLCWMALSDRCDATLKYIVDNSDDPDETRKKILKIKEIL